MSETVSDASAEADDSGHSQVGTSCSFIPPSSSVDADIADALTRDQLSRRQPGSVILVSGVVKWRASI